MSPMSPNSLWTRASRGVEDVLEDTLHVAEDIAKARRGTSRRPRSALHNSEEDALPFVLDHGFGGPAAGFLTSIPPTVLLDRIDRLGSATDRRLREPGGRAPGTLTAA